MAKVKNLVIRPQIGSDSSVYATWAFDGKTTVNTPAASSGVVRVGDWVRIKSGATYYNGVSIPSWVMNDTWKVIEVIGDRAVINENKSGSNRIMSPISVNNLTGGSGGGSGGSGSTTQSESTVDHYEVKWYYDSGNGVWFTGSSSDVNADEKNSIYNVPSNALKVKVTVKPVSKTYKVNNTDTNYWTGTLVSSEYMFSEFPPEVPSVPKVELDKYTLKAIIENIDDPRSDKIEFQVYNGTKLINSGEVQVVTARASFQCTVEAGGDYRVRARSINLVSTGQNTSNWSNYSESMMAIPSTPGKMVICRATSETSVYLEWPEVETADTYDVEYTTQVKNFDGSDETSTKTGIEFNHFEVTGLESGEEYFFRVRGVNEQGESGWSEISSVVIGKAPSPPTTWSSATTVITGNPLNLYWVHNSEDGSSQTYAELELYINGQKETHTIKNGGAQFAYTTPRVIYTNPTRNVLRNTAKMDKWNLTGVSKVADGVLNINKPIGGSASPSSARYWIADGKKTSSLGKTVVVSFDMMSPDWKSLTDTTDEATSGLGALDMCIYQTKSVPFSDTPINIETSKHKYLRLSEYAKSEFTLIDGEWIRYMSVPITLNESFFTEGTDEQEYLAFLFMSDETQTGIINIKNVKMEFGTTATDWSPAPEDSPGYGEIETVRDYYQSSTTDMRPPTSWGTGIPPLSTTNKYLWNYEKITYKDGTTEDTQMRVIATYGDKDKVGSGITSIVNYYIVSSENTGITEETLGWSTTVPKLTEEKRYLWNYEKIIYSEDEEAKNKTSVYPIDTSSYPEGTKIQWRVRTSGITLQYGDWSIQRTIDIYAPPTLELKVTDVDGDAIALITEFPFYLSGLAGPKTQEPIGYHVSITANSGYETVDSLGNQKFIVAGEAIYSKYFDTNDPLLVEFYPGNIDLENDVEYTATVTVTMNSGLTGESSTNFRVEWTDADNEPDAQIAVDLKSYVAYITPYCMNLEGELITDVYLSVYRREFDGTFTELAKNIDAAQNTVITDPHPALDYARYRIVAMTKDTGSVSFYDPPGYPVQGKAIIIQWDEEWSNFDSVSEDELAEPAWVGSMLMLPGNIDVSDNNNRDVSLVKYIGRKYPVAYYGTHVDSSATWNLEIPKDDRQTLYNLRRLAIWMGDVYVREPSGSGYWANVNVSFSQKHCELTIPVTLDITRVEGGA